MGSDLMTSWVLLIFTQVVGFGVALLVWMAEVHVLHFGLAFWDIVTGCALLALAVQCVAYAQIKADNSRP